VRQSASGGLFRFSTTGSLFQRAAASKHRVGAGARDANNRGQSEGISVVVLPSVAYILYSPDDAGREAVAKKAYGFVASDSAKIISSVDPA
jgi:hypothetical protein